MFREDFVVLGPYQSGLSAAACRAGEAQDNGYSKADISSSLFQTDFEIYIGIYQQLHKSPSAGFDGKHKDNGVP